ncbi:MAG: CocE/NonD family hydrolase [Flavipsychrobacter sp.]|nr:CocE/NonD family hydrolase [Flavipsychrobacter sp.]
MKKLIILIIVLLCTHNSYARRNDSLWMARRYTKIEQYIPMRDGTHLFTSIYVPDNNAEQHPILLTRTPYSCAPYGADTLRDFWSTYEKAYLQEHYILVIQDVRGKWMSEGKFEDVRPCKTEKKTNKDVDETTDCWDTIDWLVKNIPNNNGKVGLFGTSYPGFYSLMGAACGHPALVAVSPQAPCIDWFTGDDDHHNGAFFVMDEFDYDGPYGLGFGVPHPQPTSRPPLSISYPVHDNYKFYLENEPLSKLTRLTGDTIRFWKDLMNHGDYDDWWKARDARKAAKDLKPAMLWVGGTFDAEDNWGAWNGYLTAEKNNPHMAFNKLVMGPWYHGQWSNNDGTHLGNISFGSNTSTWYQQNIEIPFFNYYLKGEGDISKIAKATVFISGANEWKEFAQWPPRRKQDEKIYLQDNDALGWKIPRSASSYNEYVSDPHKPVPYTQDVHFNRTRNYMTDDQRFADRRPDVASFKTDILQEDVTLTGNVLASLQVSISTTDADFVVKLIDVFPDSLSYNYVNIYDDPDPVLKYPMGGYEMLVHGEILRGKYRNSLGKPEPFVPGKITPVSFKIGDVAHTFKKGHRIMVQVQSSWFPLVDMNPQRFENIYKAKKEDFQKSTIRIYHDSQHPSYLVLPVFKGEQL